MIFVLNELKDMGFILPEGMDGDVMLRLGVYAPDHVKARRYYTIRGEEVLSSSPPPSGYRIVSYGEFCEAIQEDEDECVRADISIDDIWRLVNGGGET